MPTYEYECHKCGAVFEAFQRITDRPLTRCRECGAKGTVSRLVSAGAGLIFKGSGFYITDYKRAGSTADKDSPSEKKSDASEKSSHKKDKTETSTVPKTPASSD